MNEKKKRVGKSVPSGWVTMIGSALLAGVMLSLALMSAFSGCQTMPSTSDIPAVTGFDAERYMGVWHEIARLPKNYERGLVDVTATYALKGDMLVVTNRGFVAGKERISTAVGHFAGAHDVGEFRVSFFRPFYGDYRVIGLSPEYDAAMVTSNDRSSLWIIAREKTLPESELREWLAKAAALGFDIERLEFPGASD